MQGFEEAYQRRHLRRRQILPVGRHVSSALQHLVHQLIISKPGGHSIESWAALAAQATDHVTIAALLFLKDNLALPPQRRGLMHISHRNDIPAPGLHLRTPGGVSPQLFAHSEPYCKHSDREHRDRPPSPALLPFSGKERQCQQEQDAYGRSNQYERRLQVLREKRENGVKP